MPTVRIKGTKVQDYRLHAYAPGDGTIAFSWVNQNNQADGHLIVTREDVDDYLDKNTDLSKTHKVIEKNGYFYLFQNVVRKGNDLLQIGELTYRYEIAESIKIDEIDYFPPNSFVAFVVKEDETFECKHYSTLSVLKYFLLNEKELTRQIV